jgi:hypothetical protein
MINKVSLRRFNKVLFFRLLFVSFVSFVDDAAGQTSFPMITHVHPVAVQRGKTAEVAIEGQMNFAGAYKALFEGKGLSAEFASSSAAAALRTVKTKLAVDQNAVLGVREFRVATTIGISSVGQLVVVNEPVVVEAAANNTQAQAQKIDVPQVVAGKLEALEDVDYYKFNARAGEMLTFELYCARLQDKIHDLQKHAKPMLTLYDAEGRELAANDHFYFADPLLSFKIAKTGDYYIQVRDSTYDGDPRWVYALVISNKPYASHAYPMAGQAGQRVEIEPVGSARALKDKVAVQLPKEAGLHQLQLDVGGVPTNPVTFYVSKLGQAGEQEPNDELARANRIELPCGINGRIGQKRDQDHYVFKAHKGKGIRFELKARRFGTLLNSSLHGILEVLTAKGVVVAGNDTTHGLEASLVFTPNADGEYILRIRDLNSKGGETAVYHVEADWAAPDFTIRCDPDKAMLGPGASTAWYVQLTRTNGFTGPVKVDIKGLPRGVSASPLTILPEMTQGVIVLTAAAGTAPEAANVELVGSAEVKDADNKTTPLVRGVTPIQEIYSPGGGRARFDVNLQSVAVTSEGDITKVNVSAARVSLKPGEEVKIDVDIQRRQDYDKGVSLDVLLQHLGQVHGNPLPPGVTLVANKSKTLLGSGNKGHIVLKAAPGTAPIEDVPICVIANVSVNFVVKLAYASEPILISVRK